MKNIALKILAGMMILFGAVLGFVLLVTYGHWATKTDITLWEFTCQNWWQTLLALSTSIGGFWILLKKRF